MKSVIVLTGDYTEDYEVMVPCQALSMLGYRVDAVCPGKRKGEMIRTAVHDFEDAQTYSEKPGHLFRLTRSFVDVEAESCGGLYITGGRAPEYLRLNHQVITLVREFMRRHLPVAAICHGVQILTAADLVRGRRLTAYPAVRPEVEMAGGTYLEIPADEAVVDGNLVTAPAWPAHPAILRHFARLLGTELPG